MKSSVSISDMATQFASIISDYDQDVTDAIKDAVDEQTTETVSEIKASSPRKTGAYAKGWRKKKAYESTCEKRNTVYNATRYQLAHLLEFGHVRKSTDRAKVVHIAGSGWTKAIPHLAPAEENATKGLEEKIKKAVNRA